MIPQLREGWAAVEATKPCPLPGWLSRSRNRYLQRPLSKGVVIGKKRSVAFGDTLFPEARSNRGRAQKVAKT
jgi:hypothetical protein